MHELPPGSNEHVEVDVDGQRFEMDPEAQRFELESNHPPAHEILEASPDHDNHSDSSQLMQKASSDSPRSIDQA
jgi:hypothetical protein